MPAFKDVFSTTWKVVLSLMIVSAIAVFVYFLLSVPSRVSEQRSGKTGDDPFSRYDASDYQTKMPKSAWDKRVAWAVSHHCYFVGMSKVDAIQALGPPTEQVETSLTYYWLNKDCVRYEGNACAEHKKEQRIIFLYKGYVSSFGKGVDCYTLSGANEATGLSIPSERAMATQKRLGEERAANEQRLSALRVKCAP
jgi:hypothetical protein